MTLQERLLWLARIPSRTGEERVLADEIARVLAGLDLPGPPRRHGGSLVVPLAVQAGAPSIVFSGHLDVAAAGNFPEPRLAEGRLYGAGVAEMKSGLALMLDLAERPPAGVNVTAVFHALGEAGYDANQLKTEVLPNDQVVASADLAVVLKPTDNALQLGCGGSTHATFLFAGQRGHSGQPSPRKNAIHRAHRVLSILAATEPVPDVVDALTWYELMNATCAQSGQPGSVVPDELSVNIHHTYGPSTTSHQSQERLMALADRSAILRFEDLSPAAPPLRRDHPLVRALEESGVRGVAARQTWTEVACFARAGLPAVNFGPGTEAQAHQKNEWTEVAALGEGRAILDRFFAKLRGAGRGRQAKRGTAK